MMVLILVLVEYALREQLKQYLSERGVVLILVLVEYALREFLQKSFEFAKNVLILVLVEYALRVKPLKLKSENGKES